MVHFAGAGAEKNAAVVGRIPRRLSPAELERMGDEIAELAALADTVVYQMLVRLREFERCEGWGGGFATCAHWLSWRTGIALGAAREKSGLPARWSSCRC